MAAGRTSKYRNKTHYFCSDSCKRMFDNDADGYLKEVVVPPVEHPPAHATGDKWRSSAHGAGKPA
jgi:YHS domain-containing protein